MSRSAVGRQRAAEDYHPGGGKAVECGPARLFSRASWSARVRIPASRADGRGAGGEALLERSLRHLQAPRRSPARRSVAHSRRPLPVRVLRLSRPCRGRVPDVSRPPPAAPPSSRRLVEGERGEVQHRRQHPPQRLDLLRPEANHLARSAGRGVLAEEWTRRGGCAGKRSRLASRELSRRRLLGHSRALFGYSRALLGTLAPRAPPLSPSTPLAGGARPPPSSAPTPPAARSRTPLSTAPRAPRAPDEPGAGHVSDVSS